MTAFASIIFAALPGLGAKSGADGAVTADGQAMAGQGGGDAFQALLAGLTAAAPAQPDAQAAAAATPLSTPAAAVLGAGLGEMIAGTPGATSPAVPPEEAIAASPVGEGGGASDSAEALAAAGAVLIAPAAMTAMSSASATPAGGPAGGPTMVPASSRTAEEAAAGPAQPINRPLAKASMPSPTDRPAPGGPDLSALMTPGAVSADVVRRPAVGDAWMTAWAPPPAASVAAGPAVADPAGDTPPAPPAGGRDAPPSMTAAPRASGEAVTSLIGRVLEGARRPEAGATVREAVTEATSPSEVPTDAVGDTPVELALDTALSPDAPVPVEAAVVETPIAPSQTSGRRTARTDAARADVAVQAADGSAPDLKAASRADARPSVDAAPAPLTRPEPPLTLAPVADLGAQADPADPATLDAAPATPTLQAAAEMPAETTPTRGSPETVARLASDIARKLEGKTTRFDVQLDPLGLGKVDVSIEINADGRLSASLSFDSAQTAADLRGRAGELRQALEKAGFDLADGGLSFDMNNPGGSGGREARETLAAWSSRAFQTARSGLERADALAARSISSRTPSGGVDIRI